MHRRARKRVGRREVTDQNPIGSQQRSCSDAYPFINSLGGEPSFSDCEQTAKQFNS